MSPGQQIALGAALGVAVGAAVVWWRHRAPCGCADAHGDAETAMGRQVDEVFHGGRDG